MGVSDCHSERVCGIGSGNLRPGEQHLQHGLYLALFGSTGTNDRLLDQPRGMLIHCQPACSAGCQNRTPRLCQLQCRLRILVKEDFLGCSAVGRMAFDNGTNGIVEMMQSLGNRGLGVGLDLAIGDMRDARSFRPDHAPAGAGERRVKAENYQPSFSMISSEMS